MCQHALQSGIMYSHYPDTLSSVFRLLMFPKAKDSARSLLLIFSHQLTSVLLQGLSCWQQTGKQVFALAVLPNASRGHGEKNEALKWHSCEFKMTPFLFLGPCWTVCFSGHYSGLLKKELFPTKTGSRLTTTQSPFHTNSSWCDARAAEQVVIDLNLCSLG